MFMRLLRSFRGNMIFLVASLLGAVGVLLVPGIASVHAASVAGHVYVLNNTTSTNSISVYNRYADGSLVLENSVKIGGQGTGAPLGSQGSLQLSADGHWIFAVDAGSNQISVLHIGTQGDLTLTDVASSQGVDPVSLTYSSGRLYVVNDGDATHPANVSGFSLLSGKLVNIPQATKSLSTANPAAGEIRANPLSTELVVTEKNTSIIDGFRIFLDGSLSNRISAPASGATPYGFSFNPVSPDQIVVSDAAANAVTTYAFQSDAIKTLDGPVADQQSAPCWLVVTNNGEFAYTANAGSTSVSGYAITGNGNLTLQGTTSTGTGNNPIEMTLTPNNTNLYTLNSNGTLSGFQVHQNGSLTTVSSASVTIPAGSTGIAAN
jgi:6-phosphogluconolactonase